MKFFRAFILTLAVLAIGLSAQPVAAQEGEGKIAFVSKRNDSLNDQIYLINPDGSGITRLTDSWQEEKYPSWSPDGRYIAYSSWVDGGLEIFIMNADGSEQIQLTDNSVIDEDPSWVTRWTAHSILVNTAKRARAIRDECRRIKPDSIDGYSFILL